jgi:hypothetical protein
MIKNINKYLNEYIETMKKEENIKLSKTDFINDTKENCYNLFIRETLQYIDYSGKKLKNHLNDLIEGYEIYYNFITEANESYINYKKHEKLYLIIFYYYYLELIKKLLDSISDSNKNLKEILLDNDNIRNNKKEDIIIIIIKINMMNMMKKMKMMNMKILVKMIQLKKNMKKNMKKN